MNFKEHSNIKGCHSFLGASKYHWINYDAEKIASAYTNHLAVQRGTILHDFAAQCISLKQKLPRNNQTLNMYVNDAIGFQMIPEQVLYYSDNCFGTADAIKFSNNLLRIHDLKTGNTPAKIEQLLVYTALFCLEYDVKPSDINIELRIYQFDKRIFYKPRTDEIVPIMDKIVTFDKIIDQIKMEEM